jgi:hypothetical protein
VKVLLRLYPPSWRRRYGQEMEVLLEDLPGEIGVGLDLVRGAAVAYATVVRGNRILSAAGAYLHGVAVAVLLQAIVFVSFVLYAERSGPARDLSVGPVHLAAFYSPFLYGLRNLSSETFATAATALLAQLALLAVLIAALIALLAAPRLVRAHR